MFAILVTFSFFAPIAMAVIGNRPTSASRTDRCDRSHLAIVDKRQVERVTCSGNFPGR